MHRISITVILLFLATLFTTYPVSSADLTREQVVALLKQATSDKPADLRRKNLQKVDLSGLDLRHADLWGADLRYADLSHANLAGQNLDLTIMRGTDLSGANLQGVSIFGVIMIDANLSGANLKNSRVIATLDRARLVDADLENAFWGADMKNQTMGLMRASCNKADFTGAKLKNANFNRVLLKFAKLRRADMDNINLYRAVLSGADLSGAKLRWADLREAHLDNTDFSGADLTGVRLEGALDLDTAKGMKPKPRIIKVK